MNQKNEVTTDIALVIEEQPYVEMMKYAHMFSPNECSGTGLVERVDYNDGSVEFIVKKVYLPNQLNHGASTDIPDDEMAKTNTLIVEEGDDTVLHKFHWHSHVDMGVFHSGTDTSNYDDMQTGDYAVSLVVNKKYNMLGSVHLYKPLRINVLNIEVEPPDVDFETYEVPQALLKKLEKNVARVHKYQVEHKPVVTHYPAVHYQRNWDVAYSDEAYAGYGQGLAFDPDFFALLRAGEQQGLIKLIGDNGDISGYMNTRTQDCYELTSYLDYVTY